MKRNIFLFCCFFFIAVHVQAQNLNLLLDWYPNPDHAPIFVAAEQGFFKAQGLNVNIVSPTDPGDPLKLLAAGKADIVVTYQPALLIAIQATLPIVRIGTLVNSPLNAMAVLQNSSIYKVRDLKGKKIGYATDGTEHAMLKTLLASGGLTLQDVQLINVHYGLTQALMSGKVDAVTGIMRNFEPLQMQAYGQPARLFKYEEHGVPAYDELIYVARQADITNPSLSRFLTALSLATEYLIKNPEASWKTFANNHPELNNTFNHQAWLETIPYFAMNPALIDKKREEAFSRYWQN